MCVQSLLTDGIRNPTFTRPVCLFRNVLRVDGQPQPWLWKDRPYFAVAAGALLVFVKASTRCADCGKRIAYGLRDSRNGVFCTRCLVESAVTSLPTNSITFRHARVEVSVVGMPTSVWPDQFPVVVLRDFIKKDLGETEASREVDGSDLEELVGPSWFG
jgi:hypothetical protein